MKLYIAATTDRYELPVYVGESWTEVARMLGLTTQYIYTAQYRQRAKGINPEKRLPKYKFFTVEVE